MILDVWFHTLVGFCLSGWPVLGVCVLFDCRVGWVCICFYYELFLSFWIVGCLIIALFDECSMRCVLGFRGLWCKLAFSVYCFLGCECYAISRYLGCFCFNCEMIPWVVYVYVIFDA